jgi:hypothetical protein
MAPRNAVSFLVEKMEYPGKPGAVRPIYHPDTKALMGINHGCPCGCGLWSWLRLNNADCLTFQKWDIQGQSADVLRLTLTPSIGIRPITAGKYHWHGYLKNGVFEEG